MRSLDRRFSSLKGRCRELVSAEEDDLDSDVASAAAVVAEHAADGEHANEGPEQVRPRQRSLARLADVMPDLAR